MKYFTTSLRKRISQRDCVCPNCGSKRFSTQDIKFIVTELRRCEDCRLLYRSPSDNHVDNEAFYQSRYVQGSTTELPNSAELSDLVSRNFAGTPHDYAYRISILRALGFGNGHRLFDYGCSWGYGSWQLAQAGFEVRAYDVSRPRSAFARTALGVNVLPDAPGLANCSSYAGTFDCFFSSHVVEHVPKPAAVIRLAAALLKPGGYFVAFTPNGSGAFRNARPTDWHRLWGKVHPNLIDDQYWKQAFGRKSMLLGSSPMDLDCIRAFRDHQANAEATRLDGVELVCIARF